MSLSFPKTDLLSGLTFSPQSRPFKPVWRTETSRTSGGITRIKEMGPLLWSGHWQTVPMRTAAARELEAGLLSLDGGAQVFEGYDPRDPLPASDKTSALLGVTVQAIQADRRAVQLIGLPPLFVLTRGDWLSIDDGSNLHLLKVVETVTAGGTGLTPMVEVRPALRAAITVTDPVVLRYAPARFMLDANSVDRAPAGGLHEMVSFSAIQVIE